MKKFFKTVISALVCLGIIVFALSVFGDVFGGKGIDVEMTISEGASGADVIEMLENRGVIEHPLIFKVYASVTKMDSKYKCGDFAVNTGNSYAEILKILTDKPNSMANKVKITIPEGFEAEQIANAMEKAGITDGDDFLRAVSSDNYDFDFVKSLDNKSKRKYVLEGYLFPATYTFSKGTPAEEVVEEMLSVFEQVVSKYDMENVDDVITLASIIEREAVGDVDRRKVSSVFHNRLNGKDGLTKLQSCATVQYVLGERKAVLSESDTRIKSPYNTYIHDGLPVGPIANPGEESIKAALSPEATDYLYFGLNKNGEHIFSKTYEEHLSATK